MKRLTFAVAGAIIATLTACTTSSSPSSTAGNTAGNTAGGAAGATSGAAGAASGSQTGHSTPAAGSAGTPTSTVAPAVCKQRYDTWQQGPGKGLVVTLSSVGSASVIADAQALSTALKKAQPALARAAQHPLPACADPKGYWLALLMHVNAAAGSKGSASRTAAMRGVPTVTRGLLAELKHTETS